MLGLQKTPTLGVQKRLILEQEMCQSGCPLARCAKGLEQPPKPLHSAREGCLRRRCPDLRNEVGKEPGEVALQGIIVLVEIGHGSGQVHVPLEPRPESA